MVVIFKNPENLLCDYGCGQIAKYKFSNNKICCEDHSAKCNAQKIKTLNKRKLYEIYNGEELCSYGCNKSAKFILNNGKFCCENNNSKCSHIKEKNSLANKGNIHSFETKIKISKSNKLTLTKIKNRYPILLNVEELKETNDGKILGRCKNSKCKNSKENNGWFELSCIQIRERYIGICKGDLYYFYCCEECKQECPLYRKSGVILHNEIIDIKEINYSQNELSIWKNEIHVRQLQDNPDHSENFCEICHSTENLQVHHIQPQKLEPGYALDPDNGMILCQECHFKHGHEKGSECSTGNLKNIICKQFNKEGI